MTDTKYERVILQNIEEHGWFCTSVFDPESELPAFSYSVGFTQTLDSPEFIVFGLDVKIMHALLWQVFRDIQAGRNPEDMQRWSGLLAGHECVVRAVHPTNHCSRVPEFGHMVLGRPRRTRPFKRVPDRLA